MPRIQKLSDEIISRVAAGEVIEHPASVVKELIENSIDAGATEINVEIEDLGLSKIKVIDNGHGIEREDLENSVQRHSTSKISNLEDLANINTLGFRGEALFSIAAVSKFEIKSRVKSSIAGYSYAQEFSKNSREHMGEIRPVGMPEGTVVTVEDLFYNLPGRKKFYSDKSYVSKKIVQVVTEAALANPLIGFRLSTNGKINIQVPKEQVLSNRIGYLLGDDVSENFIELAHVSEYFEMKGFLSKPQGALHTADFQYLFVNNRPVQNRDISKLIRDSFGSLLESKSQPVFIISLTIPANLLDINVHPRKSEVLFLNNDLVLNNVNLGVRKSLGIEDLSFRYTSGDPIEDISYADVGDFVDTKVLDRSQFDLLQNNKKSNPYLAQTLKDSAPVWNIKTDSDLKEQEILQIHNLYLITETKEGLLVLDQHAVHERILFEEFLELFQKEKRASAQVEVNEYLDLPVTYVPLLEGNIETLEKIGIYIEKFRKNTYKIRKIPEIFLKHDLKVLLLDVLKDLEDTGRVRDSDQDSIKTISYLACRSAIKGGDYLTMEERRNLLEKLSKTKSNYTCPHGRPVKMEISKRELAKMFKRV